MLCAVPGLISGIREAFLVPESPRWLIASGQDQKALSVIRAAARINGVNPDIVFHTSSIKLKDEHVGQSGFKDF